MGVEEAATQFEGRNSGVDAGGSFQGVVIEEGDVNES